MPRAAWVAVVVAAIVVLAATVTEVVGRSVLADTAEQRLRDGGISGEVDVRVGRPWRPSVLRALGTGELDSVEVTLGDATVSGVRVRAAQYRLEHLEVAASLRRRTVGATSLGSGTVRIVVDESLGDPSEVITRNSWFLPCRPTIERVADTYVLDCTGSELPGVLRSPLGPGPSEPMEPTGPDPDVQLQPPVTLELEPSDTTATDDGG